MLPQTPGTERTRDTVPFLPEFTLQPVKQHTKLKTIIMLKPPEFKIAIILQCNLATPVFFLNPLLLKAAQFLPFEGY